MTATTINQTKKNAGAKLFKVFAAITGFFIVLLLTILPYRFYERDVQDARARAKEVSEVLKSGILSTMIATGESKPIRNLIHTYQEQYNFKFRMVRSQYVEKQHGVEGDMQAKDELMLAVLKEGKGKESWLDNTTYRYITPFIADKRCKECHEDLSGEKVKEGMVLGASELIFDLKAVKAESIRFIVETLVLIVTCLVVLGLSLYWIVRQNNEESSN